MGDKNRLVKATNLLDSTIVEFNYDVLGRRYKKETAEKIVEYVYANENILQEKTTDKITSTTTTKDYINGLGTDVLIAYEENSNIYYYHTNHQGSVIGISDNTGNTVVEYDYDVFGKVYVISGNTNFENNRLYTCREYDKEIGLYYNRARYYNAELARFISRDPIDIRDDVNLYAYVGNNGVMYTDILGLAKALIFIGNDSMDGNITFGFNRAKNNQIKYYLEKGYKKENIKIEFGKTISDFNSYVKEKHYDDISIIAHGNYNGIVLDNYKNNQNPTIDERNEFIIKDSTLKQLPDLSGQNTNITLISCMTGYGDNSIAQKMSNKMGVTVKAPDSYISPDNGSYIDLGTSSIHDFNSNSSFYDNADVFTGLVEGFAKSAIKQDPNFTTFNPQ